jgi:hypothetical protein
MKKTIMFVIRDDGIDDNGVRMVKLEDRFKKALNTPIIFLLTSRPSERCCMMYGRREKER